MTKIECIMMALKYFRALVQLSVCYGLTAICMKLNGSYPEILRQGNISAAGDALDVLKAFGLNEQYEELKRMYYQM